LGRIVTDNNLPPLNNDARDQHVKKKLEQRPPDCNAHHETSRTCGKDRQQEVAAPNKIIDKRGSRNQHKRGGKHGKTDQVPTVVQPRIRGLLK
jgi:hypothetical protein